MLLDPINSITSVKFYKKVSPQNTGRTFLYLAYLGLLFSIAFTVFLKTRIWPSIQETFQWLETSVPVVTYANGRLSTPANQKISLRHPRISDVSFTIDTSRTEPVSAQMLSDEKVTAYVTANALYILEPSGKVDVYDFSKSPSAQSRVFDAKFYRELARDLRLALYPAGFLISFVVFLIWKTVSTLFYSLVALLVNGLTEAGLGYKSIFNLSAYAQTLVIAVQGMLMLIPASVPHFSLLAAVAITIYLWLAIKSQAPPRPLAA